jgi:tyrosyl-tRNA synthetase
MGGGTTKVGDPSFRAEERPLLTARRSTPTSPASAGLRQAYLDYGDGPERTR